MPEPVTTSDTDGAIIGVQVSLLGFFMSWLFRESSIAMIGVLFVVFGTIVVFYNVYFSEQLNSALHVGWLTYISE
ncbi:hypothetical protein BRD00_11100 [Halobacteriales archaeon QS_8_69_26]|nr:MAG: hypothetical protein BRD00_11100 [Halobacteriales archaeon QS_8_69_26]